MNMKDRMKRLEVQMAPTPVDRARIERDARAFKDSIERLAVAMRASGRPMPTNAEQIANRAALDAFMASNFPRKGHVL